jgi:hypothetical protein
MHFQVASCWERHIRFLLIKELSHLELYSTLYTYILQILNYASVPHVIKGLEERLRFLKVGPSFFHTLGNFVHASHADNSIFILTTV